jgi:uncharacterized membrane protein
MQMERALTVLELVTPGLLWFSAIGCGLLAGLYFAFSAFIMTALDRIDRASGIAAMNAINVEIVRSLFMPLFMGTTITSAALAAVAVLRWGQPGALLMLAGGVLYVVGMFGVTLVCNVPLNNALAAVDKSSPAGAALWGRYLKEWTFWNHARTIACTAASALYIAAIAASA